MAGRRFPIVRMESRTEFESHLPFFEAKTEVLEHDPVGVKAFTIRPVHRNQLRRQVQHLLELYFLLPDLFFGCLTFRDIGDSPNKLAVAGCALYRMGDRMNVLDAPASQPQAILMLEVSASTGRAIDDLS